MHKQSLIWTLPGSFIASAGGDNQAQQPTFYPSDLKKWQTCPFWVPEQTIRAEVEGDVPLDPSC